MEFWSRLLGRRCRRDEDLDDEIESHLQMAARERAEQGESDKQARTSATREFGNVALVKEVTRDMWSLRWLETLLQDLRYGLRQLRRNPGFAAVAVVTLALGIGADTAIFSVVNAVLLRPLPYPQPERIVQVNLAWKGGGLNDALTVPEFEFYRDHAGAFQAMAGFRGSHEASIRQGSATEWIAPLQMTDGFFRVLGVSPAIGRGILRDETRPGAAHVAVLSDSLWRKAFRADPKVIGRQLNMDDVLYTIVGVMPPEFRFVEQPSDVFIPLQLGRSIVDTGMNTRVIARLKPGASLAVAQANINLIFERYRQQGSAQSGQRGIELENYQRWLAGDLRTSLLTLFGAVGLLLMIACANVAGLIMARANSRQREVSIRRALGAARGRLLQQFLGESLLIAIIGGVAGLLAAGWVLNGLMSIIPWDLPSTPHVGLDGRILAFTFLVSAGVSLVFGITCYWQTSRPDLNASLREGGTHAGHSAARSRFRSALVVGEVGLSVMLLIGAGLLIRSLYCLHKQKLGFDPRQVYTMETPFASTAKLAAPQIWSFEQEVLGRLEAVPGVKSAAVVSKLPLTGANNLPTQQEGHPEHSIGGMEYRAVSPQYFQTMRIAILQGRAFLATDTASSMPVAIVSETVARAWWGAKSPIGSRVVVGEYGGREFSEVLEPPREVVGVAADVKNRAIQEDQPTTVYVPTSQLFWPPDSTAWVVRADVNLNLTAALRGAVEAVNPDQRVLDVQSMTDVVGRSVARPTFDALLMCVFGALALILTSVGVYGLISFQVARRTQEIGIRMALGASEREVLKMVIGQGFLLALIGITIGLAGSYGLSRFLSSLLYGVKATDTATFILVALILAAVALLASYLPARRATKVDPLSALRHE
jgi:putative ABC transport system permease protein